jgi:hypothetical protein
MHRLLPLALLTLLTGCAGQFDTRSTPTRITVHSSPPGAIVHADDRELGVTPLTLFVPETFPYRWTARGDNERSEGLAFYRRQGTLTFTKPGCRTLVLTVDSNLLARDIEVKLDCRNGAATPKPVIQEAPGMKKPK